MLSTMMWERIRKIIDTINRGIRTSYVWFLITSDTFTRSSSDMYPA